MLCLGRESHEIIRDYISEEITFKLKTEVWKGVSWDIWGQGQHLQGLCSGKGFMSPKTGGRPVCSWYVVNEGKSDS